MPRDHVIAAALQDYRREIYAALTVALAFVAAKLLDRAFVARGERLAEVVPGGASPAATTRLRLVRRLAFATVVVIGFALALSQFEGARRIATGLLASSAVLGLVVGFAARQTLANAVAGILLAITQPIRIGDLVTFEGTTGTVEDVRLTYTYLDAGGGRRLVIPNERLAASTIENHTLVDPRVSVEVSVWMAPDADVGRALAALEEEEGVEVAVAEVDKDGVRVAMSTWVETAADRGPTAAALRATALERLRREGLSSAPERS